MTSFSASLHVAHRCILLATVATSLLAHQATSSAGFDPLPLKWRPFNVKNAPEAEMAWAADEGAAFPAAFPVGGSGNGEGGPHHPAGLQQRAGWVQPRQQPLLLPFPFLAPTRVGRSSLRSQSWSPLLTHKSRRDSLVHRHPSTPLRAGELPYAPMRAGEMKSFVDGLKSRIKSEISLLLALTDEEEEEEQQEEAEVATVGRSQLREFLVGDNAKMRKFMPLPLLKGSRN